MADLDQLVVPDWMRDDPAPALPKFHVKKPSEPKVEHKEEPCEEQSAEEESGEEESTEEDSSGESSEDEENLPKVQTGVDDSKAKKDQTAEGETNDDDSDASKDSPEPKASVEDPEAAYQDVQVRRPRTYEYAEPLTAKDLGLTINKDDTAFEVVKRREWKSKPKDPNAPAPKKAERDDNGDRVLVIKGRPPKVKPLEYTPTLTSKTEVESETTGDPEKSEMPQPLAPITNLPKSKKSKKNQRIDLAEPVEEYVRPTSKVAKKFSKAAAANEQTKEPETAPTNTAATIAKLKTEQEAIIRKKRTKTAAVSAPLKRALEQKRREQQRIEDEARAAEQAAYDLAHPKPAVAVEEEPAPAPVAPAETTHTRLQKAFEAATKGEIRPAIDLVATPKVRKFLPKNAEEDSALRWKVAKWAFWAFVAFIFYELHLA